MPKLVSNVVLMNIHTNRAQLLVSVEGVRGQKIVPKDSKDEAVLALCEMIRNETDFVFNITDVSKDEGKSKEAPVLYTGKQFLETFAPTLSR